MEVARSAFEGVLAGPEKDPRDRLTCWLGLARIASWRDDFDGSMRYANLYLEQVLRSEKLWTDAAAKFPREAPIYEAKHAGAAMQEAELRDLMGNVLYKLGRMKEAEEQVDIVLKTYPQRATAYLNRGILRQTRGEDDLARSDYKKFLSYTDLPDSDPSILECTRRLAEVEARLKEQEERDLGAVPPK
jgi:tetratricopeptide (TPR) repeat protein